MLLVYMITVLSVQEFICIQKMEKCAKPMMKISVQDALVILKDSKLLDIVFLE